MSWLRNQEWFRKIVCVLLDKKDYVVDEWTQLDKRKLLIQIVPYILVAYLGNKMAELYFICDSGNVFVTIWQMLLNFGYLFDSYIPSIKIKNIILGSDSGGGMR